MYNTLEPLTVVYRRNASVSTVDRGPGSPAMGLLNAKHTRLKRVSIIRISRTKFLPIELGPYSEKSQQYGAGNQMPLINTRAVHDESGLLAVMV